MPSFLQTINPTPFGFFDADAQFQSEADDMVTFVKRRLGDDVISVELTSKMIWTCFEEACCEYSRMIHEFRIRSELVNVLGLPTGTTDLTNTYPRQTLEYLIRMAEPYGSAIGVGGSYDTTLGYFELEPGRQDYNLYTELLDNVSGTVVYDSLPSGSKGKIKIVEMMHYEPIAAQSYMLNSSNMSNYLATEFNYESYVNTTVFYVLPVFEDVLRRQALEHAYRVRRSNFSYEVFGSNVRIYPIPTSLNLWNSSSRRLYVRVYAGMQNALHPTAYDDESIHGISGPNNISFGNIPYLTITQPGRAWIRQLCLALSMLTLGQVRSKLSSIPIPNAELKLNGPELIQEGKELREKLYADFKEFLSELTTTKLIENQANQAENLNRSLRYVPFRKSILIG